ncbi:hypothetical protein AAG570_001300 [Ranatra chinensis]|uniref:Uncharacterized protein n=1 Tax=Ranatra chinensis TaxID=642074 RepID=A0ABD0YBG4_9HEMI
MALKRRNAFLRARNQRVTIDRAHSASSARASIRVPVCPLVRVRHVLLATRSVLRVRATLIAMWFTTPENSFRMSSFKTKIRRRKYALARGGAGAATPSTAAGGAAGGDKRHSRQEASGQESAAKGVPANNWEFVSFGPGLFGPRRESSASADESGDSPSNSRPNSRPPSWLAALPHHFVIEESEDDQGTTNPSGI